MAQSTKDNSKSAMLIVLAVLAACFCIVILIMAVLTGLTGFGVSVASRNSRDIERQAAANDLKVGLEDYFVRIGRYPEKNELRASDRNIELLAAGEVVVTVLVNEPAKPNKDNSTNDSLTWYCYESNGDEAYTLGVKLENSEWYDASNKLDSKLSDEYCEGNNPF